MDRFYWVKWLIGRWALQVFYNILNLESIYSWTIYKIVNKSRINRRDFLIRMIKKIEGGIYKGSRGRNLSSKRSEHESEMPKKDLPKMITCLSNDMEVLSDEKPYYQVKFAWSNKKSLSRVKICESYMKSVCGKCVGEETIRSKCRSCLNNHESDFE